MAFEKQFQVYSTDAGHNSLVRPAAILRYLQEAAVHQMLTEGPSYRELFEKGFAFILSRINLQLYRPLYEYELVTARTWACAERGASFGRSYQLFRGDELIAEAVAVWGLIDIQKGTPVRVDEAGLHYSNDEALPLAPRFVMPRVPLTEVARRTVLYEDVDCNGHLNNTRYPDWLCSCIPDIDRLRVTGVQIHYAAEAPLGETVTILRGEADDGRTQVFETRRADGTCNVRALITVEDMA